MGAGRPESPAGGGRGGPQLLLYSEGKGGASWPEGLQWSDAVGMQSVERGPPCPGLQPVPSLPPPLRKDPADANTGIQARPWLTGYACRVSSQRATPLSSRVV